MNNKKPVFQIPEIGQQRQQIQRIIYENLDWIRIEKNNSDFIYYTDPSKDDDVLNGLLVNELSLCIEPQSQVMYILKKGKQENNPSVTQDLILANIDSSKVPLVQMTWGKSKRYEVAEKVIGITLGINM